MEKLLSIIEAQRELLNFIGYDIDLKKGEIPLFESIDIKKGNTKVGTFDIKKSNLYYLDKDGYFIGNIVKNPRYSREKEKNMHTMCHIYIKDGKNKFDCYNGIKNKSTDKNILDRCAVMLNDDYILVKTFKEQKQDFSINYDNDKISFFFIWTYEESKITIRVNDISICILYNQKDENSSYIEIKKGKENTKASGALEELIEDNKELLSHVSNLIKESTKVDLFNNSLNYIKQRKNVKLDESKTKVYIPE
ncbi:unknown [Clostridium sp. CAG:433]|jgi:hypothetical protein|nr:unknown [Clostridium sp. CAG:433]